METKTPKTRVLELEITRECQLACTHCYADSGPGLGHGTLTTQEWLSVIAQAAHLGIKQVQMIGGEPTLHPDLPRLIGFALDVRLAVEVYTNLVHVTPELWTVFAQDRVTLATSYYSDDPAETAKITGRLSYARTRASIAETVRRAIPIRVGLVDIQDGQRIEQARAELVELGVPAEKIRVDRARGFGRAAQPGASSCDVSELCGQCGNGRAAVSPTGTYGRA